VERTLLEVAMSDPDASDDLKQVGKTLLETNTRSEVLISKLLTLARSENTVTQRHAAELSHIAASAISVCEDEIEDRGIRVHRDLQPVEVYGDTELIEQMVLNLVQNAVRHNIPAGGGQIWVATFHDGDHGGLRITNTGLPVLQHDVPRMFEPFVRLARQRTGKSQGLGLSIVRSVAHSHGGSLTARPRPEGGLTIEVLMRDASDQDLG
jgi:signal transduction histidine kinase